jgi:hypothetical protein
LKLNVILQISTLGLSLGPIPDQFINRNYLLRGGPLTPHINLPILRGWRLLADLLRSTNDSPFLAGCIGILGQHHGGDFQNDGVHVEACYGVGAYLCSSPVDLG